MSDFTSEEGAEIHDRIRHGAWADPGRIEECLNIAVPALSAIAAGEVELPDKAAAQVLRTMLRRVVIGGPLNEPEGW
jgi:hypothetical protein